MSDALDRIAARLAELEHAMHVLKTAPRANRTAVRDGYTRWLPAEDNDSHIQIGALTGTDLALIAQDASGRWTFVGVIADGTAATIGSSNPDGILSGVETFRILGGVMHAPLLPSAWQSDGYHARDTNGNPVVSAASYETAWRTLLPCTSGKVYLRYDILLGGGVTSCDAQVIAQEHGSIVPAVTIHEQTGLTGATNVEVTVDIPDTISSGASPIGRVVSLAIQAKVTGGAGNVSVLAIQPALNKVS